MKMIKGEIATGIFFIVVAAWFLYEASKFPVNESSVDMGPAAFPQVLAWLVILLSVLLIITSFIKGSALKISVKRFKQIVYSMVLLIIYGVAIPFIGFYIATILFIPIMLFLAGERKWKSIIGVTIVFELFAFAIFDTVLNVPLP
jgi:putative tricarboxylic transport membrane protein